MTLYTVFNSFDCGPVDPEAPVTIDFLAEDEEELAEMVREYTGKESPLIQVMWAKETEVLK